MTNPTPPREDAPERDAQYLAAIGLMVVSQRASTSYLSRCLATGYNTAVSIMERMQADGIVSVPNHVGKREVLIRRADQPARVVKPLVWEDDEEVSSAIGAGFEYLVELSHNGSWYHVDDGEPHSTREAAKAAAQADYERRILAALMPAAQDDAERVAEAARVLLSDNEACLRFAEGFDREDAAQMGEPSPHIIGGEDYAAFAADRISCVKAGLRALGGRT